MKLFILLLSAVSSFSIAQTVDNGTWTYDVNSDGTSITLTGCSNRDCPSDLVIPASIDNFDVTIITGFSSLNSPTLRSVVIADSVLELLSGAMNANNWLSSIKLSNSLVRIGDGALLGHAAPKLTLPATVQYIGYNAIKPWPWAGAAVFQFLGDRPEESELPMLDGGASRITYCTGKLGWPGSSIANLDPEPDCDADGVLDPDDAFPFDESETTDTDGDGVGNNTDDDDDGDGILDVDDVYPLDPNNNVFTYSLNENIATITGCAKSCPTILEIPQTIDDYPVKSIAESAFAQSDTITSAIIPDHIETIGPGLLYGASSLNDVIIGDGVETLPSGAFGYSSIRSIDIGDSVNRIESSVFNTTENLESVSFGASDVTIGEYAFYRSGISQLILPETITGLGYQSFFRVAADIYILPGPLSYPALKYTGTNIFGPDVNVIYCDTSNDTDTDSVIDCVDTDDDNDGVNDENDAFPLNPNETTDTDGDGIGNNADPDDDNDGLADQFDDLPLDPNETTDTDGDGIGNNADIDDDGDGVVDSEDLYPLDANRQFQKLLDIDGNDKVDALTDGLLILRYVFGLRGDTLTNGVVANDATNSPDDIEAYLQSLMPSL